MPGIDDVFASENKEIAALTQEAQEVPQAAPAAAPTPVEKPAEPVAKAEAPVPVQERQEDRRVPLSEVIEERRRRQAAEQRIQQLEAHYRQQALLDQQKAPKIPDPAEDLGGHLQGKLAQQEQALAEIRDFVARQRQSEEVAQQNEQFTSIYKAKADEFRAKSPDFMDAYKHLGDQRNAELEAAGLTDPNERLQQLLGEERAIVARALREGVNPAERLYAMAKMRGYKQAAPVTDAAKLENVRRGQEAASSLSGAGGATAGNLSLEALANMSENEFAKAMAGKSLSDFA